MRFSLVLLAGLLVPAAVRAQPTVVEGALSAASDTLTSGEYKHVVEVEARAGDRIVALLTSGAFDPYLIVRSPTGAQTENDDCTPGDRTRACLDWRADTTGTFRVIATTYARRETGAFTLTAGARADGTRAFTCPPVPGRTALAGAVEYALTFAPDGRLLASAARTSAPTLQLAVDRVVNACRALPLPTGAAQVPETVPATFRFPSD